MCATSHIGRPSRRAAVAAGFYREKDPQGALQKASLCSPLGLNPVWSSPLNSKKPGLGRENALSFFKIMLHFIQKLAKYPR